MKHKMYKIILVIFLLSNVKLYSQIIDYIFFIDGCYYSGEDCKVGTLAFEWGFMKPVNIDVKMQVSFTKSCKYISENSGWNKLYRLEKYLNHKDRSLRLGWRTNQITKKFEIGLYAHIKGEIESVNMDYTPDFNEYNDYYMKMSYNGMFVRAGNNSYCIKREIFNPDIYYGYGLARGAYFGGANPAPKFMDMWVKNAVWNSFPSFWDDGPNKGFCNSIFYSDEYSTVVADKSIVAPLDDTHDSDPSYTTIESGANITFIAGEKIILKEGFHAKSGSHFRAMVSSKIKSLDTISNIFLVNEPINREKSFDTFTEYKSSPEQLKFEFDNFSEPLFNIYPNPSPGLFTLHFDDGENAAFGVDIINMVGNVVYKTENVKVGNIAIDIRERPKGVYFVKISAGNKIYTEKVVVQ